jgi:hypothetical protein
VGGAADQGGEDRVVVPARDTQPGDVATRADDRDALTVAEDGVLTQDMRLGHVSGLVRWGHFRRRRHSTPAARTPSAVATTP